MTSDVIAAGGAEPVTSAPDIIDAIAAANDAVTLALAAKADAQTAASNSASNLNLWQTNWLGAQAGDPTLDLNNQNLLPGALYFNSTVNRIKRFDGTNWFVWDQKILYGAVNPNNATDGVNGDFWINTATGTFFGPKLGGVWSAGISFIGPAAWAPIVAWTTATPYVSQAPASVVSFANEAYVCITAHTSSAAFATDAAKWTKIAGSSPVTSVVGQTGVVTAAQILTGLGVAAASDILAGTDNAKVVTSLGMKNASAIFTLTDAATIAWNMNSGVIATVTLTATGRTMGLPTNPKAGWVYTLIVKQDGTGSKTITTWNACFDWGLAGAPTLSTGANKYDMISMLCVDAATPKFASSIVKGFG